MKILLEKSMLVDHFLEPMTLFKLGKIINQSDGIMLNTYFGKCLLFIMLLLGRVEGL